jgi:hypothetical protein
VALLVSFWSAALCVAVPHFAPASPTKKAAFAAFFYYPLARSRYDLALTSLESWIAFANHENLAATAYDLAVTVPRLGGLQRVKHLHGKLLTLYEKLRPGL